MIARTSESNHALRRMEWAGGTGKDSLMIGRVVRGLRPVTMLSSDPVDRIDKSEAVEPGKGDPACFLSAAETQRLAAGTSIGTSICSLR